MSPQHDYIIDNSTGANVRSDINSVLQAISSTNSGSSAPSTTYAFQLFANTTTSKLQIRNAANNAFIDLIGLDGSILLADGSVSAPSLAFADDSNTGLFSSAADTFNVATGGVERMELGATTIFNESGADVDFRIEGDTEPNLFYVDAGNERIGIGTSSPSNTLHIKANAPAIRFEDNDANGSAFSMIEDSNGFFKIRNDAGNAGSGSGIGFEIDSSEKMRIDSSGRLMIGTTTEGAATGDNFTIATSSNTGMTIRSGTSSEGNIFFSDATSGDGESVGMLRYEHANNAMVIKTANAERLRVDSSGNVGIGVTPATRLHIEDTAPDLRIKSTNAGLSQSTEVGRLSIHTSDPTTPTGVGEVFRVKTISANANGADYSTELVSRAGSGAGESKIILGASAIGAITFSTNASGSATERMRIDSDGQLFIGTTSTPNGTSSYGAAFMNENDSRKVFYTAVNSTAQKSLVRFHNGNGQVGTIQVNGTATSYVTSSDYRLKENAVAISDGITRLKTLKPYRFNFKTDASTILDGFFAHEVTAVPEAISGDKDAVKEDGSIDPQGIDQSKLVPLLVAAVKELIGKVEALEAA